MNKNKEAEKCKKQIEQLRKLPQNHRCANCSQLSVPYVCLDYGTFVCTRCAGLLREINAKVKSITASKFTPAEVAKITGNELDAKNYLARWDESIYKLPGPDDKERASEFIRIKYEELRWATNEIRAQYGKEPLPDVEIQQQIQPQPEPIVEQQQQQEEVQEKKQEEIQEKPQQQQIHQQPIQNIPIQRQQLVHKKEKINPFDDLFNNTNEQQQQPVQQEPQQQEQVQEQVQQEQVQEQKKEEQPQQQDDPFADLFFDSQPAQSQQQNQPTQTSLFDKPVQQQVQQQPVQKQPSTNVLDDLLSW